MREKKVTVKFYLNKDVKAKDQVSMAGNIKLYPVYCRVTYDRKSTKFKVEPEIWLMDGFMESPVYNGSDLQKMLDGLAEQISGIIKFENQTKKSSFRLNKFRYRLQYYTKDLVSLLANLVGKNIDQFSQAHLLSQEHEELRGLDIPKKLKFLHARLGEDFIQRVAGLLYTQMIVTAIVGKIYHMLTPYQWYVLGLKASFQEEVKKFLVAGSDQVHDLHLAEFFIIQGQDILDNLPGLEESVDAIIDKLFEGYFGTRTKIERVKYEDGTIDIEKK